MVTFDPVAALKTLAPALDTMKGLTGTAMGFDPMNVAVNAICEGMGADEQTKNVVKLVVGLATSNYLMAADGAIGIAQSEITKAEGGAKTEVWADATKAKPCPGYSINPNDAWVPQDLSSSIKDIMNNPSMSIEEKIMLILQLLTSELDNQLLETTSKLERATKDRAQLAHEASKTDSSAEAKGALAAQDTNIQSLQMQMQRLLERRTQMFQLMSTLSSNFNQMAMCAIQNMGRA